MENRAKKTISLDERGSSAYSKRGGRVLLDFIDRAKF